MTDFSFDRRALPLAGLGSALAGPTLAQTTPPSFPSSQADAQLAEQIGRYGQQIQAVIAEPQ